MFISEKLIFLQLQKAAGTHIARLLDKCIGGERIGKHNWLEDYDTGKYIIGSVRNPWEWYVSLWAFGCKSNGSFYRHLTSKKTRKLWSSLKSPPRITILKRIIPGNLTSLARRSLKRPCAEWKELYSDYKNPDNFRKWIKLVLQSGKDDLPEDYPYSSIKDFAGFMTYRYCKLFHKNFFEKENFGGIYGLNELEEFDKRNNLIDFIIRTETLEKDLISVLGSCGYEVNDRMEKTIYGSEKVNTSDHLSYSFYYDEETAKMVFEKEKFIIAKYEYKCPIDIVV